MRLHVHAPRRRPLRVLVSNSAEAVRSAPPADTGDVDIHHDAVTTPRGEEKYTTFGGTHQIRPVLEDFCAKRCFMISAWLLLSFGMPLATPPSHAVLAITDQVMVPQTSAPASVDAARQLRRLLAERQIPCLSESGSAAGLQSLNIGQTFSVDALERRLEAAEDAMSRLDAGRSIEILEDIVRDLSSDIDFTEAKRQLMERIRLQAAVRLMGLAGPAENGDASTTLGQRAKLHLQDVWRANPTLVLSVTEYPPKFHRLAETARTHLQSLSSQPLHVSSTPAGGTVLIEGLARASTPTSPDILLPPGRYRVRVQHGPVMSFIRRLDIRDAPVALHVDLDFEGALWAAGPGLLARDEMPLSPETLQRIRALLDVDVLTVVGIVSTTTGEYAYGVRMTSASQTQFAAPWGTSSTQADAIVALHEGLNAPGGRTSHNDVFPSYLQLGDLGTKANSAPTHPETMDAPAIATESDSTDVWVWTGITSGVLLTSAIAGGALWFALSSSPAGNGRFTLEVVP